MIRVLIYQYDRQTFQTGGMELLEQWQPNERQWVWIDLYNADVAVEYSLLADHLQINPLGIADAQRERHPPKMEIFDECLLVLLRGLSAQSHTINYSTIQIACLAHPHFLVTRHVEESVSIDRVWQAAESGKLNLDNGSFYTLYKIARTVVDRYTPILMELEERLETVEDDMFASPSDSLLAELVNYNSRLKKLRRTLSYQKNVFLNLAQTQTDFNMEQYRHEFNDVYEHFERLSSLANLHQELTGDLINSYMSLSAHRLNRIMKLLTIATVIFLPLSLLAGIYGMNFEHMPELHWRYGYFVALGIMGGLVVTVVVMLRRLKWL